MFPGTFFSNFKSEYILFYQEAIMKIVDLSSPLVDGLPVDPPMQIPKIKYSNHKDTAEQMAGFFKGCTVADLPEGNGWAVEEITLGTHSGTHLDAPWHFYPTMNGGEPSWTIDQVPLEWCIGPGFKIDFSAKPDGYKVMVKDMEEWVKKTGYQIKPGNIALLQSGAQTRWGKAEYLFAGVGFSAEATEWLIDKGVKVMGTDGWSWDVPLPFEGEEFSRNHDASIIWEAHRVSRKKAYCHIEKLQNLEGLPLSGYTVSCLPFKILKASAGWCRAVAIFDK
jgi:kynurenine formamidase